MTQAEFNALTKPIVTVTDKNMYQIRLEMTSLKDVLAQLAQEKANQDARIKVLETALGLDVAVDVSFVV